MFEEGVCKSAQWGSPFPLANMSRAWLPGARIERCPVGMEQGLMDWQPLFQVMMPPKDPFVCGFMHRRPLV